MHAWSSKAVREAEEPLLAAGQPLMATASRALATIVLDRLKLTRGRVAGARVVALVGSGNNGGDVLFAAAFLAGRGLAVEIVTCGLSIHPGGEAAVRRTNARRVSAAEASVEAVASCDVVLDGVTGIGGQPGLREPAAGFFVALEEALARQRDEDDARRSWIWLTAEGRRRMSDALDVLDAPHVARAASRLDPALRESLLHGLHALIGALAATAFPDDGDRK